MIFEAFTDDVFGLYRKKAILSWHSDQKRCRTPALTRWKVNNKYDILAILKPCLLNTSKDQFIELQNQLQERTISHGYFCLRFRLIVFRAVAVIYLIMLCTSKKNYMRAFCTSEYKLHMFLVNQ